MPCQPKIFFDIDPLLELPTGVHRYSKKILEFLSKDFPFQEISMRGRRLKWAQNFQKIHLKNLSHPSIKGKVIEEGLRFFSGIERACFMRSKFSYDSSYSILFSPCNPFTPPFIHDDHVRKVLFLHDIIPLRLSKNPQKTKHYRQTLPAALVSDLLLVNSHFTKEDLIKFDPQFASKKICVTHLGTAIERKVEPTIKERYLKNPKNDYILFLGALTPRKNYHVLLRAWNQVRCKNTELLLVGAPSKQFREFQKTAPQLFSKNVTLSGYAPEEDLAALYSGALFTVFPSLYEGFGLPALESMRCKTFCLASNTTSLPEIMGENLPMLSPHSVDEWALWIERLIHETELRDSLNESAYQRSLEFSWEKTAAITKKALLGGF